MPYPNIISFMKRHGLTVEQIGNIIEKSRKCTTEKLKQKTSSKGKVLYFNIYEANALIDFFISTEQNYLKEKFGDNWEAEWNNRWGHIHDWFKYLFFDQVVPNGTNTETQKKGA